MKYLANLCVLLLLLLGACGKDDSETPASQTTGGMSAKINGEQYSIPAVNTSTVFDGFENTLQGYLVKGTSTERLVIRFSGIDNTGTYSGSNVSGSFTTEDQTAGTQQTWSTPNDSTSNATITVTKWDEKNRLISGTFSFTAVPFYNASGNKTVTEGSFTNFKFY